MATPEPKSFNELTSDDVRKIHSLYSEGSGKKSIAYEIGCTEWAVRKLLPGGEDQLLLDSRRLARKDARLVNRTSNAIELLNEGILAELKLASKGLGKGRRKRGHAAKDAPVAVVTISDVHANEIIDEESNGYDLDVMSRRFALLAERVRMYATANGCERVVVALLGDLINSPRRLDERMMMATSRARAVVVLTHIVSQFIMEIREFAEVDVISVSGNESRMEKELCFSNLPASDNLDMTVHHFLELILSREDDKGLRFLTADPGIKFMKVHQETLCFVHGTTLKAGSQASVQAFIGKWAQESGVSITHLFCGHIHSTLISDLVSRNSSMSGSNAYSSKALNFASKAAQNLHIVHSDGRMEGIKVDLNKIPKSVEGYEFESITSGWDIRNHQPRKVVIEKL
jgi:hypothetical protein